MSTFIERGRAHVRRFGKRHPGAKVAAKRALRVAALSAAIGGASVLAGRRSRTLYGRLRGARAGGMPKLWRQLRLTGSPPSPMEGAADLLAFRARRARTLGHRLMGTAALVGGLGIPYVARPAFEAHADYLERRHYEKKVKRGETVPIEVWVRKRGKLTKRAKQGRRFR